MTQPEAEHEQAQRTTDHPVSEPAEAAAPMRELASVIGNQAFVAGVLPGTGVGQQATPAVRPRIGVDQLLREAVEMELARALEPPPPRVRGGHDRAIQRVAPQGSMISQLAQLRFGAERHTEPPGRAQRRSPIRNPSRVISALSEAVGSAWATYQATATISGVIVNAVTATGGVFVAPPLTPLILASAPKDGPAEIRLSVAAATAIGSAFSAWQPRVRFLGFPLFPSFAAVPSPAAPPTPGVPMPLAALTGGATPVGIGPSMIAAYGDPLDATGNAICSALADAIDKAFSLWTVTTMVTNVLGSGPVPTWAPPYVPVGPVVGGIAFMPPGGLI